MPLDGQSTSKFDPQYCIYCQDQIDGRLKTREEVRLGCIQAAQEMFDKTEAEAIQMVDEMLPKLPRWQQNQS
jgi:hypothetical protein